jgi:hypothetical protein
MNRDQVELLALCVLSVLLGIVGGIRLGLLLVVIVIAPVCGLAGLLLGFHQSQRRRNLRTLTRDTHELIERRATVDDPPSQET